MKASSIAVQQTLATLIGRRLAKANSTVGTSFTLDFAPLHWIPRRQSKKGSRWFGGYFSARTYILFEGCDWRIQFSCRDLSTGSLPHELMDRLLARLVGSRLLNARLSGPFGGVRLHFSNGTGLSIRPGPEGYWWIGTRNGTVNLLARGRAHD